MAKIIAITLLLVLFACSAISTESFYEGIRSQDKAKGIVKEPSPSALPNFQQYEQERQGAKSPAP
ncbi:MAG: hypothetical protein ACOYN1_06500 [Polynucleobacter sp.]